MSADDLMVKAERALASARLLLDAGDTDGACNRAYYVLAGAKKRGKMAKKGPMKKVVMDQGPSGPWVVREGSSRDQKGSSSSMLFTWSSGVSRSWLSRSATVNWKA